MKFEIDDKTGMIGKLIVVKALREFELLNSELATPQDLEQILQAVKKTQEKLVNKPIQEIQDSKKEIHGGTTVNATYVDLKTLNEIVQNQKIVDELVKIESVVLPSDISPDDARFIRYDYVRSLIKETTGKDIKDL